MKACLSYYFSYGFDEMSGNFQQYNIERGGKERDAVIIYAQDGSGKGYNDAFFSTPPDGSQGICQMYLFKLTLPYRDGGFDAGVLIHELSHGMSSRLIGGSDDSGCLADGEASGMSEGWGDFFATMVRSKRMYSDFPIGAWVYNKSVGIRGFPYSLVSIVVLTSKACAEVGHLE
jgi:extracellular elastinolytic metalloproteinase